jgi:mono/diheme cytochrome c family protein
MRTRPLFLASALMLGGAAGTLTLAGVPESQAAGDPTAGRQLTRQLCADCHRTPGGAGGGDGPSLDRLSRDRSFSPRELADVMATDPHDGELRLSRAELANISAYLNVAGTPGAGTDRQTAAVDDSANEPAEYGRRSIQEDRDDAEEDARPRDEDADDVGTPRTGQRPAMRLEDVIRTLSQQGYSDIREVEREGRDRYEVYARDPDGRRVELKVDALTGKIVEREYDD